MTISDEQLQRDKKYFFEFAQSDEAGLDFAQIKFCETMVAYISEVERLQSLLDDKVCAEVEFLREQIEKLQAENAELKEAARKVVDLRNSLTGAPIAIEELRRLIVK